MQKISLKHDNTFRGKGRKQDPKLQIKVNGKKKKRSVSTRRK